MHIFIKKYLNKDLEIPFPRMTYDEAFAKYGHDKPDLRFGLQILMQLNYLKIQSLNLCRSVLDKGGKVGALHVRGNDFSRGELING